MNSLLRRSIAQQEQIIQRATVTKHEFGMRISYVVDKKIKYLHIAGNELYSFLKRNGVIDHYAFVGDNKVRMFNRTLITIAGHRAQPVQKVIMVAVEWEEIEITPSMALTFAAMNELSAIDKIMGNVMGIANRLMAI